MTKTYALLASTILLVLCAGPVAAAESAQAPDSHAQADASEKGKHTGTAECPIKKTIDGKLYCFQNDPALTKPQGGH